MLTDPSLFLSLPPPSSLVCLICRSDMEIGPDTVVRLEDYNSMVLSTMRVSEAVAHGASHSSGNKRKLSSDASSSPAPSKVARGRQ